MSHSFKSPGPRGTSLPWTCIKCGYTVYDFPAPDPDTPARTEFTWGPDGYAVRPTSLSCEEYSVWKVQNS